MCTYKNVDRDQTAIISGICNSNQSMSCVSGKSFCCRQSRSRPTARRPFVMRVLRVVGGQWRPHMILISPTLTSFRTGKHFGMHIEPCIMTIIIIIIIIISVTSWTSGSILHALILRPTPWTKSTMNRRSSNFSGVDYSIDTSRWMKELIDRLMILTSIYTRAEDL